MKRIYGIKAIIGAWYLGVCTVASIINIVNGNLILLICTLCGIVAGFQSVISNSMLLVVEDIESDI
ncbi:hypothetical protein [Sporosalibacterium faouarense]|uniref:hypothetical protein n=1 Tax=Sporosalibacterium faouarense TaxID=516123 RepID=UPI00192BDBCA|nr:hypothetical protein [Sporosalibacterium faouarense]